MLASLCPSTMTTIFPYTTLFRSVQTEAYLGKAPSPRLCRGLAKNVIFAKPSRHQFIARPKYQRVQLEKRHKPAKTKYQDRKSTRLNSSHRTISYAAFCLKKKITT